MSETYPRKNHCETLFAEHTPPAQVHGAKVVKNLRMCKKIAIFFAIFSLEDARGASYTLEMRGEEYSNIIRENKHKKETVLGNESTFLEH